ncbi:MAG: hypothetical protein AVDCRST_MAG19-68 [uncultured Thermomicrobiales bacterium]|uniref:Uncharacterized protein n=1 Tax=uncultured Thermomicrobiales bacterium TaxID=1645740 RepID=A0A6J4U8B9_9BACT|nr:MAG: hypothetical protein AVDCRST_MAG19-68 [uncultured Thermomicrobiales bacterium]
MRRPAGSGAEQHAAAGDNGTLDPVGRGPRGARKRREATGRPAVPRNPHGDDRRRDAWRQGMTEGERPRRANRS